MLLGLDTAIVYPSLIAAASDASHPAWRARSLSVYRFWRDLGYAIGALSAGIIADHFGVSAAIAAIAALTLLSGLVVAVVMRDPGVARPPAKRDGGSAARSDSGPEHLIQRKVWALLLVYEYGV